MPPFAHTKIHLWVLFVCEVTGRQWRQRHG